MDVKPGLRKVAEITEILLYAQMHPGFWLWAEDASPKLYERRARLIEKHRDALTNNPYFTGFIEPLVLRLHYHATHSRNMTRIKCDYGYSSYAYVIRGKRFPILTVGSEEQLYEVCKKRCDVCPTVVYSPLGVMAGLSQLAAFETGRIVSKVKNRIGIKNLT
jgi:hypothetical protein